MDISLYGDCIIKLIRCAFGENVDLVFLEGIDLNVLYEFSKLHNVTNLLYEPLSQYDKIDDEILKRFYDVYNAKLMNDAIQSYYLERITAAFENNHIPYCVMKGPVMKPLYPRPDYRQSGDLDIFVDEKYREDAKKVMEELGFKIERYNIADADDVYFIKNKVNVEIHRILVSNKTPWQNECQKITDRLVLSQGKKYSYEMTIEDYYLYMIAHMAKHMKYSGMGIKLVLDVLVYMEKYKDLIDWETVNYRLDECGLSLFEESVRKLVDYWFYDADTTDSIKKMSNYIFVSGTFGTQEQLKMHVMAENTHRSNNRVFFKISYYTRFFFQPYKWMCGRYPILSKYPILLPFCWIHRAAKTVFFDREKAKKIASEYDGIDINQSKHIQQFKKSIGI